MWPAFTQHESLTRPRVVVAAISIVAAASAGYYVWSARSRDQYLGTVPGPGLHRSNAVRQSRRQAGRHEADSSATSEAGDGNEPNNGVLRPLADDATDILNAPNEWAEVLPTPRAGAHIVNLLFRVSEDSARRSGCVHRGCQCNWCGQVPIRGTRYRCANCADFDLCEVCESQNVHYKTHIFYKVRVPAPPFGPRHMQPVWYTGDPEANRKNLPRSIMYKLSRETGFERPELENFWEQWTYMANTQMRNDPDELYLAMDRKTFEQCLVPTGGSRHAAPNLIHDRMFNFYDSNKDGLIGFREFLQGLAYRKRKDKLARVFEGYDIDGDGYVDRKDFLRMFRAYYVLYKQMHKDILDGLEDQLLSSTEVQSLIAGRQPLSSLFGREGRIPRGDPRLRLGGKRVRVDGTVELEDATRVVDRNHSDTATRNDILMSLFACATDPDAAWRIEERPRDGNAEDRERYYHARDHHERMINQHVADADRPYILNALEPPTTASGIPQNFTSNLTFEDDEEDEEDDEGESPLFVGVPDVHPYPEAQSAPPVGRGVTESEYRARAIEYSKRTLFEAEKRRRDLARGQIFNRWARREFYLDEEEGGSAPDGYTDAYDEMMGNTAQGGGSTSASTTTPTSHSVAEGEGSSESGPSQDEWRSGIVALDSEKDAGKEILYQVTQQAFNELLDIIFKPSEDIARAAKRSKRSRETWRAEIERVSQADAQADLQDAEGKASGGDASEDSGRRSPEGLSIEQVLAGSTYSVAAETAETPTEQPRNAVDFGSADQADTPSANSATTQDAADEARGRSGAADPTMPQFRPHDMSWDEVSRRGGLTYPLTNPKNTATGTTTGTTASTATATDSEGGGPTLEDLREWKRHADAERVAGERGAWGKLSFDEFEEIYRGQECKGNRLDYLGSWIDFCIP